MQFYVQIFFISIKYESCVIYERFNEFSRRLLVLKYFKLSTNFFGIVSIAVALALIEQYFFLSLLFIITFVVIMLMMIKQIENWTNAKNNFLLYQELFNENNGKIDKNRSRFSHGIVSQPLYYWQVFNLLFLVSIDRNYFSIDKHVQLKYITIALSFLDRFEGG